MQQEMDESLGTPPSFMTAEFINPEGKRYNFEQIAISTGMHISIYNESGDLQIFRFWQNRQSERDYPVDQEEGKEYEEETLPKITEKSISRKPRSRITRLVESAKWFVRDVISICSK